MLKKAFIPALLDRHIPSNIERKPLSLPVKLGGMVIVIFADITQTEYQNSTCNLILLDKNTGLRPIGVGEVLQGMAGKVIASGYSFSSDRRCHQMYSYATNL